MPEPDGGNFCGTGKWLNRIMIIIALIALAFMIWRCWTLVPKIAAVADDLPQIIENLRGQREIHTTIQVIVNVTNQTVNVTQICSEGIAPP